ncbi:g6645 [Coccomyxa elongata]
MELTDLDDDCLLSIFSFLSPLPDLISLSKACRRFNCLTGDGRMRLLVLPSASTETVESARQAARTRNCRQAYHTLKEAVAGSRPGDRIVLEPGTHDVGDVHICWPLHLVGGGQTADDTVLCCSQSIDGALDFRASGKVENLTVHSRANACITHRQGALTVEGCNLRCTGTGLSHLFAPLVTLATLQAPHSRGVPAAAGAGVLTVVETKIRGGLGSLAVRTLGSGALRCVRIINLLRGTLFWFKVDSAVPAAVPIKQEPAVSSMPGQQTIKQEVVVCDAVAQPPLQPSWARSPASPSVEVLEQRAKAWHMAHHKERVTLGNTLGDEEDRPSLKRQRSS